MIDGKEGNIKFDLFWRRLRHCFDAEDSSDQKLIQNNIMPWWRSRNRRASVRRLWTRGPNTVQLTGKAGPEKRKHEDDNSEPSADDNQYVTNKRFNDLFSLMGQIVKNTNSQKENQGQGRQGDCNSGYNKEREPYRRQMDGTI